MGQVFRHAEQYLDQLNVGFWVEIGTSRNGDDGSTRVLAEWAKKYCRYERLTTVDVDPNNCDLVRSWNIDNVEVVNSTGEEYLESFPAHIGYIGLLYLDNFDWDWHPENPEGFVRDQMERYTELGLQMNNVNSQRAHLAQAQLALRCFAPTSLVICDDTWYNKWWGHYSGKSGSAIPMLLNAGFKVLYTEEQPVYGTILGRGIKT